MSRVSFVLVAFFSLSVACQAVDTVPLWPDAPPEWTEPQEPETNMTKPDGRKVAGRDVVRLGNVSRPELHLYPAENSDSVVVICPGGGYSILAWNLEGTEIAEWLQQHGVSAAVLKYRVPTRNESVRWLAPTQDIQRAIALIRGGGAGVLKSDKVGVLGFSAGGNACAHACTAQTRHYEAVSAEDESSFKPDFGVLVYAAYLVDKKNEKSDEPYRLPPDIEITDDTPPMFFAHAYDDKHSPMGSLALFAKLKEKEIPAALHVFSVGGHGFGGRETGGQTDAWLPLLVAWMKDHGWASTVD